jgi:eukaryotic-like serine/threonine-protein kinase
MVGGQRGVAYVDPAIILGARPSSAADVYSLGALAHLAACGTSIYPGLPDDDPLLAARTILKRPPTIDPRVEAALAEVIVRATAREQADRYASALALGEALTAAVVTSWGPQEGQS